MATGTKCRCRICLRDKGHSRTYPNRAAVIKHRRRAHPDAPKAKNWSKEARKRRENGGTLPTVARQDRRSVKAQLRYCTSCGTRRGAGWKFCGGCGSGLDRRSN